jgi:hypothetical protein
MLNREQIVVSRGILGHINNLQINYQFLSAES